MDKGGVRDKTRETWDKELPKGVKGPEYIAPATPCRAAFTLSHLGRGFVSIRGGTSYEGGREGIRDKTREWNNIALATPHNQSMTELHLWKTGKV